MEDSGGPLRAMGSALLLVGIALAAFAALGGRLISQGAPLPSPTPTNPISGVELLVSGFNLRADEKALVPTYTSTPGEKALVPTYTPAPDENPLETTATPTTQFTVPLFTPEPPRR